MDVGNENLGGTGDVLRIIYTFEGPRNTFWREKTEDRRPSDLANVNS